MSEITDLVNEVESHEINLTKQYGATDANVDLHANDVSVNLTFAGFDSYQNAVDAITGVAEQLDEDPDVENINLHVNSSGVWQPGEEEHDDRPGGFVEFHVTR